MRFYKNFGYNFQKNKSLEEQNFFERAHIFYLVKNRQDVLNGEEFYNAKNKNNFIGMVLKVFFLFGQYHLF